MTTVSWPFWSLPTHHISQSLLLLIIITKILCLIFSRSGGCFLTVESTTTIRKTWQQSHDRFGPSLPTPMASQHPLSPPPQTSEPPGMFHSEQVYPVYNSKTMPTFILGEIKKPSLPRCSESVCVETKSDTQRKRVIKSKLCIHFG